MTHKFRRQRASLAFAVLLSVASADAALNITMNYGDFNLGPGPAPGGGGGAAATPVSSILLNDSYTGATTDAARLADAVLVMDEAVSMIEGIFACVTTPINYTIDVGWEDKTGGALATGGAFFGAGPTLVGNGFVEWDADGSSSFFVDTSPGDNVEFNDATGPDQRTLTFAGGPAMNVEDRYYAGFGGAAEQNNSDMLSVAIHEIMHALGALTTFNGLSDTDSDNDFDFMAPTTTYEVPYNPADVGHTNQTLPWSGPGSLGGSYYPNVLGPATVSGTRGLITDLDALVLTNALKNGGLLSASEIENIKYPFGTIETLQAIPEPSRALLLLTGLVGLAMRRRR